MPKAEDKQPAARPGFDDGGRPYKGVDPDTGKRLTVVLSELKKEFGPKKGEEMYARIRVAANGGAPLLAPRVEEDARDIGLDGAPPEVMEKVQAVLEGRE